MAGDADLSKVWERLGELTAQAFPNECTNVVAMHIGTNAAVNVTVSNWTTSGFTVHHNGTGNVLITYIATGY